MKKVLLFLTFVTSVFYVQGQDCGYYASNVSIVSTTSDNFYLKGLEDTYYSCNEEGVVEDKKSVYRFIKKSSGGFEMQSYEWNGKEYVKSTDILSYVLFDNISNIGKVYFLEVNHPNQDFSQLAYVLTNSHLYLYALNECFIGKGRKFSTTEEFRNFIEANLNNSSLFNKLGILKKMSAENNSKDAETALGVLVVGGLIKLLFSDDSGSNGSNNSGYKNQNDEKRAYQIGKDRYGNPTYEDRFGNKVDSYGNQIDNY